MGCKEEHKYVASLFNKKIENIESRLNRFEERFFKIFSEFKEDNKEEHKEMKEGIKENGGIYLKITIWAIGLLGTALITVGGLYLDQLHKV